MLLESKSVGTRRAFSGVKPTLASAQRALAPPNLAAEEAAHEAYSELKDQFQEELFSALRGYQANRLTGSQLQTTWRTSIRSAWTSAFELGNQAEGYTHGLEDVDYSWLKGAWGEEYGYLGKFVQALEADTLKMPAEDRLGMYVETLDGIFNAGRVDALPENAKIHWVLHPADHCIDCKVLAGASPYDKPGTGNNPLPTTPRSGDTRCLCLLDKRCNILTIRGIIPIGSIHVGEFVWTHRNRWRMVTASTVNRTSAHHRFALLVAKGRLVGLTSDHRLMTSIGWRTAEEIAGADLRVMPGLWQGEESQHEPPLQIVRESGGRCPSSHCRDLPGVLAKERQNDLAPMRSVSWLSGSSQVCAAGNSAFHVHQEGRPPLRPLLGRDGIALAMHLSLPVDLDSGEWPDSPGLRYPSRERELLGRQAGEPGASEATASLRPPRGIPSWARQHQVDRRKAEASMQNVPQSFSQVQQGRAEAAVLLNTLRGPRTRQETAVARDDLRGMQASVSCEERQGQVASLLLSTLLQQHEAEHGLEDPAVRLLREAIQAQTIADQTVEVGQVVLLPGMLEPGTPLYDLTVEEDHSFVVEGLVAHNSNCHCELIVEEIPPEAVGSRVLQTRIPRAVGEGRPAGFRDPSDAERAFIDNMIARISFSRQAIADMRGDAKKREILIRQRLADTLTNFLVGSKLWVSPTWTRGIYLNPEIESAQLDDLMAGDITDEGIAALFALSPIAYRSLVDKYEASVLTKLASVKASPELQREATNMGDLLTLSLAGALAVVLGKKKKKEKAVVAPRDESPAEEGTDPESQSLLQEDLSTSSLIASALKPNMWINFRGKKMKVIRRYAVEVEALVEAEEHEQEEPLSDVLDQIEEGAEEMLRAVIKEETPPGQALVPVFSPLVDVHVPQAQVDVHVAGTSINVPPSSVQVHLPETRLEPRIEISVDLVGAVRELMSGLKEAIVINVAAPQILVQVPEMPPTQVTVNVPPQLAPVVKVIVPEVAPPVIDIHIPAQLAPVIDVHVAPQAAPVIEVNVPAPPPVQVHVQPEISVVIPEKKGVEKTIEYDSVTGRISKVIEKPV